MDQSWQETSWKWCVQWGVHRYTRVHNSLATRDATCALVCRNIWCALTNANRRRGTLRSTQIWQDQWGTWLYLALVLQSILVNIEKWEGYFFSQEWFFFFFFIIPLQSYNLYIIIVIGIPIANWLNNTTANNFNIFFNGGRAEWTLWILYWKWTVNTEQQQQQHY